jgi:hypothetical protein
LITSTFALAQNTADNNAAYSKTPQSTQQVTNNTISNTTSNAKKWSLYWGWNRSIYSKSDIHFSGVDHDFTLKNVEAVDRQNDVSLDSIFNVFLNPANISIPETNARLAYQLDGNTAVALNLDHMKYVVVQDQSVPISGQINGVTQSGNQVIAADWMTYEHTDGLNVVSLEYEKQQPVDWLGDANNARVFGLVGIGVLIPKTNARMGMVGQERNDEFHLAGYSVGVGAGFEADFWKNYFFRCAYKLGYINMPDVQTSARGDKASQSFYYNELLMALGIRF